MTSSEWAAWVQAIGSILAIAAAGLLPLWHQKVRSSTQREQWLQSLKSLALEVRDLGENIHETAKSEARRRGASMYESAEEYQPLVDALANFPAHFLTDRIHLIGLLHLRRYVARGDHLWRSIVRHGENDDEDWSDFIEATVTLKDEVIGAVSNIERFR
jgi:hypothetical protein